MPTYIEESVSTEGKWAWEIAGLNLLLELLVMFESSNVATQFYQTYYMQLINEIFAVMTGDLPLNRPQQRRRSWTTRYICQ